MGRARYTEFMTLPKKQRHTAKRIFARLWDEHGCAGTRLSLQDLHVVDELH